MEELPQALEIIFEVQRKRSREKISRKKKVFQLTKHILFIFLFFGPFLFSNIITFLFFIHLKLFKML
jgi:hypothetical protein